MSLQEEIYEKLFTLQWLLQRYKAQNQSAFADKSQGQGRVLAVLRMNEALLSKDLAYILGIRQQSLNELLKKLEKNGLVERIPSEKDGRVLLVKLTAKGKEIPKDDRDYSKLFKGLDEEDLAQFSRYLDQLILNLEDDVEDIFDYDFFEWMANKRENMTEEEFEKMLSMRESVFRKFGFERGVNDMFSNENKDKRFGFGFFDRGEAPEGMPGAERFDPDYDGPMPTDRIGFPFRIRKNKQDNASTDEKES